MDPLSIAASCIGLTASIGKIGIGVHQFIREVQDARSDMDAVSRELGSLSMVLEIVAEDVQVHGFKLEDWMRLQVVGIIGNCSGVMERFGASLQKYQHNGMATNIKWSMVGKMEMEGFSRELAAHAVPWIFEFCDFISLWELNYSCSANQDNSALSRDITGEIKILLDDTAELKASTQEGTDGILA